MLPEQDIFLESLYRSNYEKLRIYAAQQIKDSDGVEEVIQDTFCTALNKLETLQHHENPTAYLMKILKFKINERMWAKKRNLNLFLAMNSDSMPEAAAPSNSVPTSISSIFEDARNALSDEEWYIFQRHIIDGASHLEIAKDLEITVWASQKRVERIRKKLKDVLPDF